MTAETWATLITSVVVPLVLRIVVHRWPWLAEPVAPRPGPQHARGATSADTAPEPPGAP